MTNYTEYKGAFFKEGTPEAVKNILVNHSNRRFRIWLGDSKTGKSWDEQYDVCGTIGFSTGKIRVPLLLATSSSICGGEVPAECIVKIVDTQNHRVLYQHPTFSQKAFTNDGNIILADGEHYGENKSEQSAKRFCDFMNGKRMNK